MQKISNQKGFSILEFVIVVVIVSLLIVAVMKGQAMIKDAQINRLINDINEINIAYDKYLDKYNEIPGDDPKGSRWTDVDNGNANGEIDGDELAPVGEALEAWQAMRAAGLFLGDPADASRSALPPHPFGDRYALGDFVMAEIGTVNRLLVHELPAEIAEIIDVKLDDGKSATGVVQSSGPYTDGAKVDLNFAL